MMIGRWVALGVGLATLLIVGVFVSAALRMPDGPTTGAQQESPASMPTRVTTRTASWTVTVDFTRDPSRIIAVALSFVRANGEVADPGELAASLSMVGMAGHTQAVPLTRETAGRWRGSAGLLSGVGWNLDVTVEGERVSVPLPVTL